MSDGVIYTGVPSIEELASCPGVPGEERLRRGRVAVIECVQEIPCNPCEGSCKFGAIHIGAQITDLPRLDAEKCTGCALCVANCPGLAITVVDKSLGDYATVDFPYEYIPLPSNGDMVTAVNREGEPVCGAEVISVRKLPVYGETTVISIKIPVEFADDVRSIRRLPRGEAEL